MGLLHPEDSIWRLEMGGCAHPSPRIKFSKFSKRQFGANAGNRRVFRESFWKLRGEFPAEIPTKSGKRKLQIARPKGKCDQWNPWKTLQTQTNFADNLPTNRINRQDLPEIASCLKSGSSLFDWKCGPFSPNLFSSSVFSSNTMQPCTWKH